MKRFFMPAVFLLGIFPLIIVQAQTTDFVPMDETMQQMIDFYNTDTIWVVTPGNYQVKESDRKSIESFSFWQEGPIYVYAEEEEIQDMDPARHIQFFGPVFLFETLLEDEIPFGIEKHGFSYRGIAFEKAEDSFYYMHPAGNKVFTCRNGEEQPLIYVGFLAGGAYPLYVFSGNNLIFCGYDKNDGSTPRINDMEELQDSYFCQDLETRFFQAKIACEIPPDSIPESIANRFDRFVEDLCDSLGVTPDNLPRITTCFYANRTDLQKFIAAPSWQTVYGRSYGNINHISGFNEDILKHETGHSIIENTIGLNPNPFFSEGFRQYTDYFFSPESYAKDLETFRRHMETLTADLVASGGHTFFNTMDNYSISGVFVKYLIERTGLEAFKTAYALDKLIELIKDQGISLQEFILALKLSTQPQESIK